MNIVAKILALLTITVTTLPLNLTVAGGNNMAPTLWQDQCIDTMKFSRDSAREYLQDLTKAANTITAQVKAIQSLGANCVAIGTPYDEEFSPILKIWVNTIHTNGMNVWFRGNFSGWEGWFGYPKFKDVSAHHSLMKNFIDRHSDLFFENDIITPAPEAENGIIGNVWSSDQNKVTLRNFVMDSYSICNSELKKIGKEKVRCGYFSANGDVAEKVFNQEMVSKTGGVVGIDHYISSVERMGNDIDRLALAQNAKVVIGEYGAPILDINGNMTEDQQAEFVRGLLRSFYIRKDKISLINYWVSQGGSTALFNDDGSPRKVTNSIMDYYKPGLLSGRVRDTIGRAVSGATVKSGDGVQSVTSAKDGFYSMVFPAGNRVDVSAEKTNYNSSSINIDIVRSSNNQADIIISPKKPSFWYRWMLRIHKFFS